MGLDHGAEFVERVAVLLKGHLHTEMAEDFGELFALDRELELAAGLEHFEAFGRLRNLRLDVEQAVANLDVRLARVLRGGCMFRAA